MLSENTHNVQKPMNLTDLYCITGCTKASWNQISFYKALTSILLVFEQNFPDAIDTGGNTLLEANLLGEPWTSTYKYTDQFLDHRYTNTLWPLAISIIEHSWRMPIGMWFPFWLNASFYVALSGLDPHSPQSAAIFFVLSVKRVFLCIV